MAKNQPEVHSSHIERMLRQMERSSHRWEKIVFPAMIAFILLAGYGFFLVYSVTRDMSTIAQMIEHDYSDSITQISGDIHTMVGEIENMRHTIATVSDKMDPLQDMRPLLAEITKLNESMSSMDQTVAGMNNSMYNMGRDVGDINDSFSSPTKMFRRMMPW